MVLTKDSYLPSEKELTVQEINISISGLRAGAFHLGKQCEYQNNEFVLCRQELRDPRMCIKEGKDVTTCTMDFFKRVKKSCAQEFTQYATCLERSSGKMEFNCCRKTQAVFDQCVLDNLHIERPEYGYFTRVKIHVSRRPKPPPELPAVYPESPEPLHPKQDYPPANYGPRIVW